MYTLSNFSFFISLNNFKNPKILSLDVSKSIISSRKFSSLNNSDDLDVFLANREIFTLFFSDSL